MLLSAALNHFFHFGGTHAELLGRFHIAPGLDALCRAFVHKTGQEFERGFCRLFSLLLIHSALNTGSPLKKLIRQ